MSQAKDQTTAEEQAAEARKDENVYTLLCPYTTPGGREVKELTLRERLKARDIREINRRTKKPEDYEMSGVAVMCGMIEDDILDMDARDYLALRDRFFRRVGITGGVSEG